MVLYVAVSLLPQFVLPHRPVRCYPLRYSSVTAPRARCSYGSAGSTFGSTFTLQFTAVRSRTAAPLPLRSRFYRTPALPRYCSLLLIILRLPHGYVLHCCAHRFYPVTLARCCLARCTFTPVYLAHPDCLALRVTGSAPVALTVLRLLLPPCVALPPACLALPLAVAPQFLRYPVRLPAFSWFAVYAPYAHALARCARCACAHTVAVPVWFRARRFCLPCLTCLTPLPRLHCPGCRCLAAFAFCPG